jgi:hypothetical protein
MGIAIVAIRTVIAIIAAAVISTAIYTPIMSAIDAIVGLRLLHRQ